MLAYSNKGVKMLFPTRQMFTVFFMCLIFGLIALKMYYNHEEKVLEIEKRTTIIEQPKKSRWF
jgi:hypothetical protein